LFDGLPGGQILCFDGRELKTKKADPDDLSKSSVKATTNYQAKSEGMTGSRNS
jgi:hypothetical protein